MRIFLFCTLVCACAPRARIVVPPESIRELAYMPTPDRYATSRHVVRMSDGTRDWEVEFPDVAVAYEVRIPLRGAPAPGGAPDDQVPTHMTAADREMMEERAVNAQAAGAKSADKKDPKKKSYLGGIARVRELYRTRNYELALIDVVDLEREYPNDTKIMAMKGSIYRKLGKTKLAREIWEKVLALDPDNATVADALRELDGEQRDKPQKAADDEGGR
jgi:tetratricopeptide (TPR) repeat protein